MATASPTPEDRSEFLWNVHSYINEYIRFGDAKAGLVIAWTTALIGGLVAVKFQEHFKLTWQGGVSVFGFVLLVLAFICAFAAVIPNLGSSQHTGLIFWKNILNHGS